jgi:alpha-beta hydrolase superfamily lysophospholipase
VERRYRADARRRILFGQSRGGTLFLFSAFTDPDLFWARIASNPVIQIARDLFFGTPAAASRRGLHLIVASGSRHRANLREDALAWFQTWQGRSGLPWRLHTMTIDGGTHAANSPDVYRASRRGLFGETGSGAR